MEFIPLYENNNIKAYLLSTIIISFTWDSLLPQELNKHSLFGSQCMN